MKREFRLRSSSDFKRVRLQGKSYAHSLFVLITLANPNGTIRIGVAAGRSVGSAVDRNRAKRRLRAAIDPMVSKIHPGWDLVLLAKSAMRDVDFNQIEVGIRAVVQRAGLLSQASKEIDDRP